MPQRRPAIGEDVSHLFSGSGGSAPAVGDDVTHLFAAPGGLYDPNRKPVSAEDFYTPDQGPAGSTTKRFFSNLGHALDPRPLIGALANPTDVQPGDQFAGPLAPLMPLVRGAVKGQVAEGRKALDLAKSGRLTEAAGHGMAALLPLLGPAAAAAGEQAATGDFAGAAGAATGLIAPIGVGKVLPKGLRVPGAGTAADSADALALAERAGITVDAGTATGNKFIKAAQHVSDRSLAGSVVAGRAAEAQRAGLATLGEQLAAKAHGRAVSGAEAGSAAQKGVGGVVSEQRGLADTAYTRLRNIEEASLRNRPADAGPPVPLPADRAGHFTLPKPRAQMTETQQHDFLTRHGGTGPDVLLKGGSAPTPASVPMIVDLSPVKAAVKPIAERLAAKKGVTGALIGKEGDAAARLEALLTGPDAVPLSVADAALSDLKRLARTNHPDLRNVGQGIAAKAVSELHAAVSATAKASGPEAVAALNEGRLATKAKYAAADVLKRLEGAQRTKSPVTAMRDLAQMGDSNIGHLRDVITHAPETKPLIARAVLDGLIDHPTAGPAKTWTDWKKIGPDTKAALYSPEHVKDLDAFFKLRKMLAENPNPSGTAHTMLTAGQAGLLFAEPVSGVAVQIGTGIVSSLLHSRAGVRLLTRGMRIPLANKAASAAWAAEFAAKTGATSPSGSQPSPVGASGR